MSVVYLAEDLQLKAEGEGALRLLSLKALPEISGSTIGCGSVRPGPTNTDLM
jgi:hypothetical protein